jgi:hypothetical protein
MTKLPPSSIVRLIVDRATASPITFPPTSLDFPVALRDVMRQYD